MPTHDPLEYKADILLKLFTPQYIGGTLRQRPLKEIVRRHPEFSDKRNRNGLLWNFVQFEEHRLTNESADRLAEIIEALRSHYDIVTPVHDRGFWRDLAFRLMWHHVPALQIVRHFKPSGRPRKQANDHIALLKEFSETKKQLGRQVSKRDVFRKMARAKGMRGVNDFEKIGRRVSRAAAWAAAELHHRKAARQSPGAGE